MGRRRFALCYRMLRLYTFCVSTLSSELTTIGQSSVKALDRNTGDSS